MHGPDGPQKGELVDGTHPDDAGYRKMAAIWYRALVDASAAGFLQKPQPVQGLPDNGGNDTYAQQPWPVIIPQESRLTVCLTDSSPSQRSLRLAAVVRHPGIWHLWPHAGYVPRGYAAIWARMTGCNAATCGPTTTIFSHQSLSASAANVSAASRLLNWLSHQQPRAVPMNTPSDPLEKYEEAFRAQARTLAPSCKVCQTLIEISSLVLQANLLQLRKWTREWDLGSKDEMLDESDCDAHKEFIQSVLRSNQFGGLVVEVWQGFLSLRRVGRVDKNVWLPAGLLVIPTTHQEGPCIGRRLDPEYIDIDVIRGWRARCARHHGQRCRAPWLPLRQPLSWLFDTRVGHLVVPPPGAEYVALSYVWGNASIMKTVRSNIVARQKPGALDAFRKELPRTITDAIALVSLLGERYLWVDALCIVQDDEESVRNNVGQMANIFENAVLTIVAGDGHDANGGLPGIRGVSEPRSLFPVVKLPNGVGMTSHDRPWLREWMSRGWTLQESIFSRRILAFAGSSIYWDCRACTYQEHVQFDEDSCASEIIPFTAVSANALTFDEDALAAFSSTLAVHRQAFPRGFWQGLPVSYFDLALLWRAGPGGLMRREPSREGAVVPPSWSWAGWNGQLRSLSDHFIYLHEWKNIRPLNKVMPMLDWRAVSRRHTAPVPVPGLNDGYDFKCRYWGCEEDLPPGWKCEHGSGGGMDTDFYYTHASCPDSKFCHPIPIGNPINAEDGQPQEDMLGARYLWAKTQRASLWIGKQCLADRGSYVSYEGGPKGGFIIYALPTALRDTTGSVMGEIALDRKEDYERVVSCEKSGREIGLPCDLVAVSRCFDSSMPTESRKEVHTFYNVLWVVWEDGTAYRRGVGRVERKAWESIPKQNIELLLG
ncbi:hypothetical protein VTK73DRAFT_10412 [Phialemonium thermophilum]|uniref:Heterokaryon incompatibility domain-containing protein n=1 Tax=Phialemonium thermophilum TaxID=223376 RepID=A0ABR3VX06_9PEZI